MKKINLKSKQNKNSTDLIIKDDIGTISTYLFEELTVDEGITGITEILSNIKLTLEEIYHNQDMPEVITSNLALQNRVEKELEKIRDNHLEIAHILYDAVQKAAETNKLINNFFTKYEKNIED